MHIENYFRELKNITNNFREIKSEKIFSEIRSIFAGKIKGELTFKDDSKLYFVEIVDVEKEIQKFKYAYEYLKGEREIFRYDNAPHHKELANFPHHKHINNGITSCSEPNLKKILNEVNLTTLRQKEIK